MVDNSELRVFDAEIPQLAMVQLPVVPLIDTSSRWVSGHYIDEFAEAHRKDIVVRGAIGAAVPSAGVACGIDRNILARWAGPEDAPFDPSCMTEDYEIGMRIAVLGGRGALVRCRGTKGIVVTREHFPATFDAAVRQKTRWLLGITLDGWDRIGWGTTLADRFMLLRDRKTLIAPLITAFSYLALLMVTIDAVGLLYYPRAILFPRLAPPGSMLKIILTINAFGLGWRLGLRAGFTGAVYGWREGIRSVPRAVVGNLINAVAAACALRRYCRIREGLEVPRWDKTAHRYPSAARPIAAE